MESETILNVAHSFFYVVIKNKNRNIRLSGWTAISSNSINRTEILEHLGINTISHYESVTHSFELPLNVNI